jgi:hypothetical protein
LRRIVVGGVPYRWQINDVLRREPAPRFESKKP